MRRWSSASSRIGRVGKLGRREIGHDAFPLVLGQVDRVLVRRLPVGLDLLAEFVDAELIDQDLDARLMDVVAATMEIVHAQDRLDVGEQVLLRQERPDLLPDIGRAPHAAADQNAEAVLAVRPAHDLQPDIVEGDGRAVFGGAGDGDLELARQPGELGMQRRPLAQDLAPRARVLELVIGGAGERIGGDVAHAIAAGLDAVHLDIGERREHLGNIDQLHPVELKVLPRGEMAVAAVPAPPDHGELAQLLRRQHAIGDGDAQHIGVELEIEPVAQAQRPELVLGQLAGEPALDLVLELRHALAHESVVELVIAVHRTNPWSGSCGGRRGCARARKADRPSPSLSATCMG